MSHSQFADLFALTETVTFRGSSLTLTIRPHEVGDFTVMNAADKKGKPGPVRDAYKAYLRAKVISASITTEDGNAKTIDPPDLAVFPSVVMMVIRLSQHQSVRAADSLGDLIKGAEALEKAKAGSGLRSLAVRLRQAQIEAGYHEGNA